MDTLSSQLVVYKEQSSMSEKTFHFLQFPKNLSKKNKLKIWKNKRNMSIYPLIRNISSQWRQILVPALPASESGPEWMAAALRGVREDQYSQGYQAGVRTTRPMFEMWRDSWRDLLLWYWHGNRVKNSCQYSDIINMKSSFNLSVSTCFLARISLYNSTVFLSAAPLATSGWASLSSGRRPPAHEALYKGTMMALVVVSAASSNQHFHTRLFPHFKLEVDSF